MSDTSAPPPAAPPAPAPSNEVVINQNPVNTSNPLGPQAPHAPTGELEGGKGRPQSRREAIQAAFDRANKPQAKPAKPAEKASPPAADAKAGHNQPPEETPKEGLDLKKRPSDQPEARPRGDRGQFVPRQQAEAGRAGAERAPGENDPTLPGQKENKPRLLPEGAPYRDPPPRISERARQDWDTAPESVRGDYHRLHQEAEGIHRHYKAVADAYQPVAQYDQMARQHGTTLDKALHNYVSMEQKLRADPVGGLDVIVNNLGLKGPNGQPIGLRDIAYHVLSQSPEQLQMLQQGNQQTAAVQQIGALHQQVNGLKQALHQMHTEQQFKQVRSGVDQFADSHPRFDELGGIIERELKLGFDLDTAYRRADMLFPGNTAAQTRTTSAQTRPVDRSISGSPDVTGSNPASKRNQKTPERREAIQNAIRRVNGG